MLLYNVLFDIVLFLPPYKFSVIFVTTILSFHYFWQLIFISFNHYFFSPLFWTLSFSLYSFFLSSLGYLIFFKSRPINRKKTKTANYYILFCANRIPITTGKIIHPMALPFFSLVPHIIFGEEFNYYMSSTTSLEKNTAKNNRTIYTRNAHITTTSTTEIKNSKTFLAKWWIERNKLKRFVSKNPFLSVCVVNQDWFDRLFVTRVS